MNKAMKTLWNILSTLGPRTGVGWYARETLAALRESALDGDEFLETPGVFGRSVRLAWLRVRPWMQREGKESAGNQAVNGARRSWKAWALEQARSAQESIQVRTLDRLHRQGKIDLYHEPNFLPWASSVPTASTFHDLSGILYPQWHPEDRVRRFETQVRKAIDVCGHFFTMSDAMCLELTRHLGVPPERITRTYNGVRRGLKPVQGQDLALGMAKLGLKPGYFLHVGTLEPRKNLLMLAHAWADLPPAIRQRHPLVLAGGWGWRCDELRQFIEETPGIIRLGYVPESELAALYSGALTLVFPSLYEGFGMPVIEMLACGGGVIASSIPALTEVLGHHAHFLAPNDAAGWRDAMRRAADSPEWLDPVRAGAQAHAARFTWKATAQATRCGYARLLGLNPGISSQAA